MQVLNQVILLMKVSCFIISTPSCLCLLLVYTNMFRFYVKKQYHVARIGFLLLEWPSEGSFTPDSDSCFAEVTHVGSTSRFMLKEFRRLTLRRPSK